MEGTMIWLLSLIIWGATINHGYRSWVNTQRCRHQKTDMYFSFFGCRIWCTFEDYRKYSLHAVMMHLWQEEVKARPVDGKMFGEITPEQIKHDLEQYGNALTIAVDEQGEPVNSAEKAFSLLPSPYDKPLGTKVTIGKYMFVLRLNVNKERTWLFLGSCGFGAYPEIRITFGLPDIASPVVLRSPGDPCDGLVHVVRNGEAKLIRDTEKSGPFNGYTPKEYHAHTLKALASMSTDRDFFNKWTTGISDATL